MKFFHQVASASIAAVLVLAVLAMYYGVQKFLNRPDSFMVVNVFVPDHVEGSDPQITYTRNIRRAASGVWVAEINCDPSQPFCLEQPKCSGNGADNYTPFESGTLNPELSWYIGQKCELKNGPSYTLTTYWHMTDSNGKTATVAHTTKPFTVWAK